MAKEFDIEEAGQGVSGIILTKEGKKKKKAQIAARKAALKRFVGMKKIKIKALMTVSGLFLDHPDGKSFSCAKGGEVMMPVEQAESLVACGQFEYVDALSILDNVKGKK